MQFSVADLFKTVAISGTVLLALSANSPLSEVLLMLVASVTLVAAVHRACDKNSASRSFWITYATLGLVGVYISMCTSLIQNYFVLYWIVHVDRTLGLFFALVVALVIGATVLCLRKLTGKRCRTF